MRRLFYLGFSLGLLFIMAGWWAGSGHDLAMPGVRLIAIGRLFGLLAAYCIILQIMLMSRVPFIERNFDLQDIIDLHRLTGYSILGAVSGHLVYLVLGYGSSTHTGVWTQFVIFNTQFEDVFWATLGTVIFFIAAAISVRAIRLKMRFEIWYAVHLTIYFAILLTFLHQIKTGGDFIHNFWFTAFWYGIYSLAFVLWLWYRALRPIFMLAKHRFRIHSVEQTAVGIYSVYIEGRRIPEFTFMPGQYATWRIFTSDLWLEAHPFSISSARHGSLIRFTAKTSGDFTQQLEHLQPGALVLIDGPRGSFGADRAEQTSEVVLIAGGIGIAPYLSTAGILLDQAKKVVLLYAVQTVADLAFQDELIALQKRGLIVRTFIGDQNGRITDEILADIETIDTTVYICGPSGMSRAFYKSLKQNGFPARRIIMERFSF
ncbi:MAG: ferredoxin reductase family protein [Candidatus Saccharibacteria bacterium]